MSWEFSSCWIFRTGNFEDKEIGLILSLFWWRYLMHYNEKWNGLILSVLYAEDLRCTIYFQCFVWSRNIELEGFRQMLRIFKYNLRTLMWTKMHFSRHHRGNISAYTGLLGCIALICIIVLLRCIICSDVYE